jgi:hypothetical protein
METKAGRTLAAGTLGHRRTRRRSGLIVLATALAGSLILLPAGRARAGNSPAFRDCSLLIGLDPDFVQLYGVTIQNGALTVPSSKPTVQVEASESSDPGDNLGHVTLNVTASAPGVTAASMSGAGQGLVVLSLTLPQAQAGRSYSISWAATFDNGMHACPAVYTLANTNPSPFVVTTS